MDVGTSFPYVRAVYYMRGGMAEKDRLNEIRAALAAERAISGKDVSESDLVKRYNEAPCDDDRTDRLRSASRLSEDDYAIMFNARG
jgi:hypothetical protein